MFQHNEDEFKQTVAHCMTSLLEDQEEGFGGSSGTNIKGKKKLVLEISNNLLGHLQPSFFNGVILNFNLLSKVNNRIIINLNKPIRTKSKTKF